MSLIVDRKYIGLISFSLDKFTQKDNSTWNARCPFCGDSKKNSFKTRLYILEKKGQDSLFFFCHNCGEAGYFSKLLKEVNPVLYKDYLLDSFGGQKEADRNFVLTSTPKFDNSLKIDLPSIESLDPGHFAYSYLINRRISKGFFKDLYYAQDFKDFADDILPENNKNIPKNHRCIVIPFYDRNKNLLGFQGRALYNTELRYITIKVSPESPKIFGLDKVDLSKRVYVVEGPIDSFFIPNSVAAMDSALYNVAHYLTECSDIVYVYDNEKRNHEIVDKMQKTIDKGYQICIWPDYIKSKDINDMIMGGETSSSVQYAIDTHIFKGLEAKLELTNWKKS